MPISTTHWLAKALPVCGPLPRLAEKVFCCLFWALLTVYAIVAIGFLGVRYWVLPRVEQWRPQIEAYASRAVGARVTISAIQADWQGLNPRLELLSVHVYEDQPAPVLRLPAVSAVLAWRSLLTLSPTLLHLRLEQPELTLRRDADNRLWVAGQRIDLNASDSRPDLNHPALRWLFAQRELRIHDARIRWQDALRQAPELAFNHVDFLVRNGRLSHRFVLRADADPALARKVELRGEFNRSLFATDAANPANWSGQLYAALDDAEPLAWAPWVPLPAIQGRFSGRAWLPLEQGKFTTLTADVAARGVAWPAAAGGRAARAGYAQVRIEGLPGDFVESGRVPLAHSEGAADLSVKGRAEQLRVALPGLFEPPEWVVHEVALDARINGADARNGFVDVRQLRIVNDDLEVRLQGVWRKQGKSAAGSVDMRGTLVRGAMNAIHRYLPLTVNPDARAWLATGLPAGQMASAAITLKGDLDEFPYGVPGAAGEFIIAGAYSGAQIDYAPARADRKGWPMLENLSGNFRIDKVGLTLDSPGGALARTGAGQMLTLGAVTAVIPDMEHKAQLTVSASLSGPVPAYLALAENAPLGQWLDGALAQARGTGDWRVPFKLKVPLRHADDTQVEGRIQFDGNTFTFMPDMPWLSQMQGDLAFSEKGVWIQDIRAQFLGGAVRMSGSLISPTDTLRFEGVLAGAGLTQISNTPSMARFSGKTAYQGKVGYRRGGSLELSVTSNLTGLAIDLPAPVGKSARSVRPLTLQWGAAQDRGAKGRRWLTASLGDNVNALFERDPAAAAASYFARGALGIDRPASLPEHGLSLNVRLPELDLDAWQAVFDGFGLSSVKKGPAVRPLLPPAERVSLVTRVLRADGHTLNDLTLYATRPAPTQWRVDLESRQAAGSLSWREACGAIAGQISARFKHLTLGDADDGNDAGQALLPGNELLDIPAIDLRAKEFRLYGRNLGELQLLGTNLERGRRWRLDKLSITNEAAALHATGAWRLQGPDRGLTVDAAAEFENMGDFMDRIGFERMMSGGAGHIKAKLTWRNLPWTHQIADLAGDAQISLDKGRFMHVNSRTARLLELLSLQSLHRLARFEVNPAHLLRDGFPFDTVRGRVKLAQGSLVTEGYKINGPVAAIVLAGGVNLVQERWNLKAVVIPNLDASGAAMVTALAVNPLIGLGAFVTQWLLKQPLAHAMTMEYAVTGSWDDPKIDPTDASGKPAPKSPVRRRSQEEVIEH